MVWSWLVWSSIQTTKSFSTSIVRLFCFLTICLLTGVALLISFKYLFFEFTTWLFVTRGLTFILSWLSTCLSHQALSFINFDLKWKTQSSSSDEHLEATVGLLTGLISVLFCSRNREAQRVSERWGNGQSVSSQNTHIYSVGCLIWAWFITAWRSLTTGYYNKYNNGKFEILRELSKCDIQTLSEQTLEKRHW